MNPKNSGKRPPLETPIWCDHCRLRVAPYEEAAAEGSKIFHMHCFGKQEMKKSGNGPLGDSALGVALPWYS